MILTPFARNRSRRHLTWLTLTLILAGCASSGPSPRHPLEHVILDARSGERTARAALLDAVADAQIVYLGEKHDNHHHQTLQRWLVEALVRLGRRPAIGLEAVAVSDTPVLAEYAAGSVTHTSDEQRVARLRGALGWTSPQSLSWQRYGPMIELASQHDLDAFGIDLPMALRRRISRVGIDGLSPLEKRLVPTLDAPDASYRDEMLARLKAAHCGHGSERYLGRLFQNWEARNETMTSAIATMAEAHSTPVVVIVGGGHLGDDRGIAARVAGKRPSVRQVNVGFVEVDPQRLDERTYITSSADAVTTDSTRFDYLWLTPRAGISHEEACVRYRSIIEASSKKP